MKIIASICVIILILSSCGKKSEPKYEGKKPQIKMIV